MALHRSRQVHAGKILRDSGFAALRVNGSMHHELLNETLFASMAHAWVEIEAQMDK